MQLAFGPRELLPFHQPVNLPHRPTIFSLGANRPGSEVQQQRLVFRESAQYLALSRPKWTLASPQCGWCDSGDLYIAPKRRNGYNSPSVYRTQGRTTVAGKASGRKRLQETSGGQTFSSVAFIRRVYPIELLYRTDKNVCPPVKD